MICWTRSVAKDSAQVQFVPNDATLSYRLPRAPASHKVEKVAGGREWKTIVAKDGVGWEEDGEMVVIRKVKAAAVKVKA